MNQAQIIYPVFALFILTIIVLLKSFRTRVAALKNKEIRMSYFRDFLGEAPNKIQVHSRNFSNLFEIPVYFLAVVLFIFGLQKVDFFYLVYAWLFVVARYIHSFIHLTYNNVNHRLFAYVLGLLIVIIMWVRVVFQILMN